MIETNRKQVFCTDVSTVEEIVLIMTQETKKAKKEQVKKEKTNQKDEKSEENVKEDTSENIKLYVK